MIAVSGACFTLASGATSKASALRQGRTSPLRHEAQNSRLSQDAATSEPSTPNVFGGVFAGLLVALLAGAGAGAAEADSSKPTQQELYYGQMVFGFKISDCDSVRRGKEPLCDDIIDWSKQKPIPKTEDRVARWRSVKAPKNINTVTETLDDKCIVALAKLVDAGPYDGALP
jgi:hypothetical protein